MCVHVSRLAVLYSMRCLALLLTVYCVVCCPLVCVGLIRWNWNSCATNLRAHEDEPDSHLWHVWGPDALTTSPFMACLRSRYFDHISIYGTFEVQMLWPRLHLWQNLRSRCFDNVSIYGTFEVHMLWPRLHLWQDWGPHALTTSPFMARLRSRCFDHVSIYGKIWGPDALTTSPINGPARCCGQAALNPVACTDNTPHFPPPVLPNIQSPILSEICPSFSHRWLTDCFSLMSNNGMT